MAVSSFPASGGGGASKEGRIDYFSATGTWTAPTGVSYAIVTLASGGGGGGGLFGNGSYGSSSSFDGFSLLGATHGSMGTGSNYTNGASGLANTGQGGGSATVTGYTGLEGKSSLPVRRGFIVTPETGYSLVVGAGGSGGGEGSGGSGGSGYLTVEYLVEV